MSQKNIDFGTFPDDPSADPIRSAFQKTQENFSELFRNQVTTGVSSVNKTPGAGVTVNKPTGDVIISANIACVKVYSSGLALSLLGESTPTSFVTLTQSSSQTLSIEFPANIDTLTTGVTNISLSGNIIAANITTGVLSATANIQGGNLKTTGILSVGGNANVGNIGTGGLITATGNIQGGNLKTNGILSVGGNANVGNIGATNGVFTNVSGNGALLTSITGANVTGTVANATYATTAGSTGSATSATTAITAGTVTTNAQPNITSVGTLANLSISGNANVGNLGTTGLITATGNIIGNYILGNGALLTGVVTSASSITNGTSNISIPSSGGNVTASVGGNANVLVVTGTGANVNGTLSVSGNANTGNIGATNGVFGTAISVGGTSGGSITGANLVSANYFSGNGALLTDITAGNVTGQVANANLSWYSRVVTRTAGDWYLTFVSANVTGNFQLGSNTAFSAIPSNGALTATTFVGNLSGTGNSNVGNLSASGNITASYLFGNGSQLTGLAAGTANTAETVTNPSQPAITSVGILTSLSVSGNANIGNIGTSGILTVTGNANVGNLGTTGLITASGNIQGGNLISAGLISAIGNITASGNLIVSNHANISGNLGVSGVYAVILSATGNIQASQNLTITGNANIGNIGTGGLITATGNIQGGNLKTGSILSVGGNANIGNIGTSGLITAAGNIQAGNLSITGNANIGNIGTSGLITAAGNVQAGNLSITGNANIANIGTSGLITAAGNIQGGNLSITGNANVGNLGISGLITAAGNITADYFIGDGSLLTGVAAGTATTAQTVTNNAQPNITSVGTLTSLTVSNRVNATGLSTSYGVTTGNSVGALNAIMGNASSATWLLSGTSDGVFRGGIQLVDAGGVMRFYEGANYMGFGSNNLTIFGTASASSLSATSSISVGSSISMGANVMSIGAGVAGTGTGGIIRIIGTGNVGYIQSGIYNTSNSAAPLAFTTILNGREWMRLDANGNLGINTQSPTSTLHVVGTANITGALTLGSTLTTTGNVNSGNIDANIISATSLSVDSFITFSSTAAISAAGTNQGTATAITTIINQVTTVSSGQGVRLPVLGQGYIVYITNDSANNLNVYPASGGAINSLGANNPLIMPAGSTLQFIAGSSSKWYSVGATYA